MPRIFTPVQRRIIIKDPGENKAAPFKIHIIGKRLSEVACPYNNQVVGFVQPQNPADFLIQIFDVVAVALLPESAKVVEILSDLEMPSHS